MGRRGQVEENFCGPQILERYLKDRSSSAAGSGGPGAQGEKMVAVPLSKPCDKSETALRAPHSPSISWVGIAAAATLAASGVLLVSGKRRAGLVMAVSGTALAMLDQQETVRCWWNMLPGYIAEAQGILSRVQRAVDHIAVQRDKMHQILAQ
jgi:hypothetical protein